MLTLLAVTLTLTFTFVTWFHLHLMFDEAPCICTHVLDVQFRKCLLTDEDSHMDIHWLCHEKKKMWCPVDSKYI